MVSAVGSPRHSIGLRGRFRLGDGRRSAVSGSTGRDVDRAEGDYYRRFVILNGVSLVPYRRAANDAASVRGGAVR